MFTKLTTAALLISGALAQDEGAIFAGGSQEAPGPSAYPITPEPTYGTIITTSGTSYVAPQPSSEPVMSILPYPVSSSSSEGGYPTSTPEYPTSTPQYPTSSPSYPISSPSYPISSPSYPTSGGGNLSTTLANVTTGGGGSATQSQPTVVIITTTGEGGAPVTETSVVAVQPTVPGGQGGSGGSGSGGEQGQTQPGAGSQLRAGAMSALAVCFGIGALLL